MLSICQLRSTEIVKKKIKIFVIIWHVVYLSSMRNEKKNFNKSPQPAINTASLF